MLERKTLTTEVSHPEPVAKPITKKLKRHIEQTGPAAAELSETVGGAATVDLTAEGPAAELSITLEPSQKNDADGTEEHMVLAALESPFLFVRASGKLKVKHFQQYLCKKS